MTYTIATVDKVQSFVKNVLKECIVPKLTQIKEQDLSNLYEEKKQEYQNVLINTRFES